MRCSRSVVPQPVSQEESNISLLGPSNCNNRQSEKKEVKYNILWSKLIIKQIKSRLPPLFAFTFVTDSNLTSSNHSLLIQILSVFFYIFVICFSYFPDFHAVWGYSDQMKEVRNIIASIFHNPSSSAPSDISISPSFYITIIIFISSVIGYIQILTNNIFQKFIYNQTFYGITLVIFEGLSFPLFLYVAANIPSQLTLFIISEVESSKYFLISPILAILTFPFFLLVISRTINDVRIKGYPFIASSSKIAFRQIILLCVICSIEPLFFANTDFPIYRIWLFLIILPISLYNVYVCISYPPFLTKLTRGLFLSANLVMLFNSILAILISFCKAKNRYIILVLFTIVNILCPLFSFLFYRSQEKKIQKLVFLNQNNLSNITDKQLFSMFVFCNSKTFPIISSIDFAKNVCENFVFSFDCIALSLRFLYSTKSNPNYIFKQSAILFHSSTNSLFDLLQLATLIELSNELMLSDHYFSTIRLHRLDSIINQCIDAHILFWRSILYDNMNSIGECAFLLYNNVDTASNYFKYLGIDEKSSLEYSKRYKNFLKTISAEVSLYKNNYNEKEYQSENSQVTTSRYNNRLSLDDCKSSMEDMSHGAPNGSSLLLPHPKKFSHNLNDRLHRGSSQVNSGVRSSRSDFEAYYPLIRSSQLQISEDKKTIAEMANKFQLDGQKVRNIFLVVFFLIQFLVYLSNVIIILVRYDYLAKLPQNCRTYFALSYALYESSYQTISNVLNRYSNFYFDYLYFPIPFQYMNDTTQIVQLIEESRALFEAMPNFVCENKLINKFFDDLKLALFTNYTGSYQFMNSTELFSVAQDITSLGDKFIMSIMKKTDNIIAKMKSFDELTNNFHLYDSIISFVIFPFLIYVCVATHNAHSSLFWQPMIIEKFEIKKIYQHFLSTIFISSRGRKKTRLEEQGKQFSQFHLFSRLLLTISMFIFIYLLQIVLINLMVFITHHLYSDFIDCSLVCDYTASTEVPYIKTIFQLLTIANHHTGSSDFHSSLAASMVLLNKLSGNDKNYSICFSPSIELNDNSFDLYSHRLLHFMNLTAALDFFSALETINFRLYESVAIICENESFYSTSMSLIHEWLSIGAIFRFYFPTDIRTYNNNILIFQIEMFITHLIFLLVHLLLLLWAFNRIGYLKKIVCFITRLLVILPNDSPFLNEVTNKIRYLKEKPNIDTLEILNKLPFIFVSVDSKNRIQSANKTAANLLGDIVKKKNIFYPLNEIVDSEGRVHYFKMINSSFKGFPYHPYSVKLKGKSYFILQDETSVKIKRSQINKLGREFKEYHKFLLPPTLGPRSHLPESVLLIDKFSMVEIAFQCAIDYDTFDALKLKYDEINNIFSTIFFVDRQRNSFLIMLSSYNQQTRQRQHLRDAVKCAQFFYETFSNLRIANLVKIGVSHGERCLCKISESTITSVEVFSASLIKSAVLLRFAKPGEIIVEWEVLKSLCDVVSGHFKFGSCYFNDALIDFRLLTNGFSFSETRTESP